MNILDTIAYCPSTISLQFIKFYYFSVKFWFGDWDTSLGGKLNLHDDIFFDK